MKQPNCTLKTYFFKFLLFFFISLLVKKNSYTQVNQQSGSATFSLPMFEWQDDKSRLNAVVALNYNSGSGLKVNDVASNVGQGWNMVAGGVITRMQVGEPDDQIAKEGSVNDITKYPAGYLYAHNGPTLGCPKSIVNYPIYGEKNHLYKQHNIVAEDRELDYFSFQFNGRSGLFVLDKSSYNSVTHTFSGGSIGDSKIIISATEDKTMSYSGKKIRTSITSFTITDETGLIYKFTRHGLTKVLKANYCAANLVAALTQPQFKGGKVYHEAMFDNGTVADPYIINDWYLTEIQDALTKMPDGSPRKIDINYNSIDRNINNTAGVDITYYKENNYSILSHKTSVAVKPQISLIIYPDGHTVAFNYGSPRVDLIGDNVLTSVDIRYKSRPLSKYQINTSYFILNRYGTPVTVHEKQSARLCLLSIKKFGVDLKAEDQPYLFDYYLRSETNIAPNQPESDDFIPPPFFHLKDIWGYYNGNLNKPYSQTFPFPNKDIMVTDPLSSLSNNELKGLCFLNESTTGVVINPKGGYAKNGLLKQIIYPTGGTLSYDYTQNQGVFPGTTAITNVGGVHVSSTRATDGGFSNGCNNPLTTRYNYVLTNDKPSLWGLEAPKNSIIIYSHYAPEKKYYDYKFPLGTCGYRFQYPGISSFENATDLTGGQEFMVAFSGIIEAASNVLEIIHIVSYAASITGPAAAIIDIIGNLINLGVSCIFNKSQDNTITVYYNSDLNNVNPLPTQFKRVEVVQNTGGAGKTVNVFTSEDDYAIWESTNAIYSMKQRYAYWTYGLPLLTTVYDANGTTKVQETEYVYDYSNARKNYYPLKSVNPLYPSCKAQVTKNSSKRNTDWEITDPSLLTESPNASLFTADLTSNTDLKAEVYYVFTGRCELKEKINRIYKQSDQTKYVETKATYSYNTENYQVSEIATTKSNGDINYTIIRYNGENQYYSDYNYYTTITSVYKTLYQSNIINIPVENATAVSRDNGITRLYLNEKVTEFATLGNGDIKPYRTLEQRFNQPVSSMTLYSGPGSNVAGYKEIQVLTYDVYGNLIGMKDEGSHLVSNIYDYDDKYIVASVINANPLIDKPAYTSFETTGYYGGWTFNGTGNPIVISSVTGVNGFSLTASNNLTASINSAKPYKLSVWANNSSVRVNGNAGTIKSTQIINGFSYYEFDIILGTASVSVTGTGNIDELRLYPMTARMRTVAYDPLIGKTAECDENNRITYYEYDELGRMRFIKDENKHIVKMYEYNNAKQSGCPATYSNNAITEIFTKNNCAAGYIGSNVTYTIPAGQYTSTISQADADQQVQNKLNTDGQAYANANGTCIKLYYNAAKSETFTKESCSVGFAGGTSVYSVPANTYTSTISQTDADQLALDEINANGQAFVNNNASIGCVGSTAANWQADDPASRRCHKDANLNFTGHQEVYMKDINPNSATYNTQQWKDAGPDETTTCLPTHGSAPTLSGGDGYHTAYGSGVITGQPGATVTVTVNLHSSDASAILDGYAGVSVHLTGSGNYSVTNVVTIPASGYISWYLNLSGTFGSSGNYISSNITF